MSSAALSLNNRKKDIWLQELMRELDAEDKNFAYAAIRAVLSALKERLPREQAMKVVVELPELLGEIYANGWHTSPKVISSKERGKFFDQIRKEFGKGSGPVEPRQLAKTIFDLLEHHVTPGEIEEAISEIPEEVRKLWPSSEEIEAPVKAQENVKSKPKRMASIERLRKKLPPVK